MKIISFKAEKVHGFMPFDITFNKNITFLVGINGSGKTTVLKLLMGLLYPSFEYLNEIEFKNIKVSCESSNGQKIIIEAKTEKENQINLILYLNEILISKNMIQKIPENINESEYPKDYYYEKIEQEYDKFNNLKVVNDIKNLKTPIFLGLDRRIYGERLYEKKREYMQRRSRNLTISKADAINYGLNDIKEMLYDYHRNIALKQLNISEEFKLKILQTFFEFIEDIDLKQPKIETLITKEKSLKKTIENLGMSDLEVKISEFFKKFKDTINPKEKKPQDDPIYIFMNMILLKKIDKIIVFSQDYQKRMDELKEPIKKLEEIINNFFKDSNKKIKIMGNGDILIELPNENKKSIFQLSSGEKQILIMISHLLFKEKDNTSGIFIIDEPELSLHLGWQEIFVESIKKANQNIQLILATHAPEIIGKYNNNLYCRDLSK